MGSNPNMEACLMYTLSPVNFSGQVGNIVVFLMGYIILEPGTTFNYFENHNAATTRRKGLQSRQNSEFSQPVGSKAATIDMCVDCRGSHVLRVGYGRQEATNTNTLVLSISRTGAPVRVLLPQPEGAASCWLLQVVICSFES
jgi:hypothetical protein